MIGVAALATAFVAGCGSSDTSDGRTIDGDETIQTKNSSGVSSPQVSAATATVTFHVKDMGTRLNLL